MGSCWPYNCFFFMVLVKIEPKEAVRVIKLRQSFPHSWDMGGTEEGSRGGGGESICVCFYVSVFMNMCTLMVQRSMWFVRHRLFSPDMLKYNKNELFLCFLNEIGLSCLFPHRDNNKKKNNYVFVWVFFLKSAVLNFEKQLLWRPGICVCSWWAPCAVRLEARVT